MSLATKMIKLPHGAVLSVEGNPEALWAVVASPARADLIRASDQAWTQTTLSEIEQLDAAIEVLEVRIEEATAIGTDDVPNLHQARLGNTSVSVLLDQDHDVVDVDPQIEADGALFAKTGQSIPDALQAEARRQIVELRRISSERITSAESPDQRMDWRVLRWMQTQDSAVEFAAKLDSYREIGSTVSILRAELTA